MTSIGLLIIFLALTTIDAQNGCTDSRATCINIRDCPPIIEILRGPRPLKAETLQTLKDAQCGFQGNDPLVCCVNQATPQSQTSTQPTPTPTPTPTLTQEKTQEESNGVPDPTDVSNHRNLRLLEHQTCGPLSEQRVINGNKTGILDFPWMTLIAYDTGRGVEFRCGGTILNKRYILTAAHCVTMLPGGLRLIGARVGDHDISKERDCDIDDQGLEVQCAERYQDFGIESFHYHPQYTRTKLQNDIALIRLNDTIDFRPFNVRAICMPFGSGRMLTHSKAIVTGWGATEKGTRSQDLLQAKLPLMSNEECREAYKHITQIWHKQLCAGGHDNVDSCLGDSGGPLQAPGLYNNNAVRTIQYGVVSYGLKQCGTEGFPGVYTNVAYYMNWILDTIRE